MNQGSEKLPSPYWLKPRGLERFKLPATKGLWSAAEPRFSWINRPELSAVSNQNPPHQTCFAHAMCRALETKRAVAKQPAVRLDADMFHSCVLGLSCETGERDPANIAGLLQAPGAPQATGIYRCGNPCPNVLPNLTATARVRQVDTASDAKAALRAHWPLVALITSEARFEQVSDFSIYRDGPSPKVYHHAILLIGYDDVANCWEVQNSYGAGWGANGRGRIAYGHASMFADDTHVAFLVG
ncbi:MAG TPA: C1 family peptidase [Allosphingosinicella sp.]